MTITIELTELEAKQLFDILERVFETTGVGDTDGPLKSVHDKLDQHREQFYDAHHQ